MNSDKVSPVDEDKLELTYDNHCHLNEKLNRNKRAEVTLIIVIVMTTTFLVLQLTGGILANSLAIVTDSAHMLTDLLGFFIGLSAIWIGRRPATQRLSFGYYRAEVIGAIISIMIIWQLTAVLVYFGVQRVMTKEYEIEGDYMLAVAIIGLIFNLIMAAVLYLGNKGGGGHGHSHFGHSSHEHNEEEEVEKKNGDSEAAKKTGRRRHMNVRAAFVHVLGDTLFSVGVITAAVVYKIGGEDYKIADPICTFVFSAIVLVTTLNVLKDAVIVLMEGTPNDVNYAAIRKDLLDIEGVRAAHNLHLWSLTLDKAALAVHLAVDTSHDFLPVMRKANKLVKSRYNVAYTTIQIEPYDQEIMAKCRQCKLP